MRTKVFIISLIMSLLGSTVHAQFEVSRLIITDGIEDSDVKFQIENNTSLLLTAMGKAVSEDEMPDLLDIDISFEASQTFFSLWNRSMMICPVSQLERSCLKRPQGGYQVRYIPVSLLDEDRDDQAQDLVFNFTKNGRIDDIFIAVHALTEFLNPKQSVKEYARGEIIAGFVENFRTAYELKDIDFLDKVFSNNALIITGKVIKEKPNSDQVLRDNLSSEKVEYVTQTKEQYLKKLKIIFNTVKYVNLKFEEIEIMKHPKYPDIYGVTLKQHWRTSNEYKDIYKDTGYLFLLIDFTGADPVIHIRAWQPSKYNGKELSREERFRPSSFGTITGK